MNVTTNDKSHKITRKDTCRLGKVQVEDWTQVYPGVTFYTVALYAILQTNQQWHYGLRGGESARIAFDYRTQQEADAAYNFLMEGGDPHELVEALCMNPYWTDWDTEHCIPR